MWQYSTFTRVIYNRYLSYKLDAAAALALFLVLMTVILIVLESRAHGRARYERLSVGCAREARPVALGAWRFPAQFFMGVLVFAGLIVPVGGLLVWLWRGWRNDMATAVLETSGRNLGSWTDLLVPAWNSFAVSALSALLVTAAALPIVILVVRRPGRLSRSLEKLSYTSYALPGIVVALALVFFGLNFAGALYQTLPVLLIAYVILFLPQAMGAQRASLMQVKPSLEEAGRSLGSQPMDVVRRITLPLLRPGLVAGAMLVFLTSMKELPAALILSPIGYSTLATQVWSNINEAFFARAAAPALLLVLLSSVPLALMTTRDHE
jgi:iron(III) transport system permease protein